MPIWVPILVLAAAVALTIAADEWLGVEPVVATALGAMVGLGAISVLLHAWAIPWIAPTPPRQQIWQAWLMLGIPIAAAAIAVGLLARSDHPVAPVDPVGICRHCGAPLRADHTGYRYLAVDTGYMCPPQFHRPGNRRHELQPDTDRNAAGPGRSRIAPSNALDTTGDDDE